MTTTLTGLTGINPEYPEWIRNSIARGRIAKGKKVKQQGVVARKVKPVYTYTAAREAAYTEWLAFVDALEPDPRFSYLSCNYKNKDGQTLLTLDQVIQAIVSNDLATGGAA